MANLFYVLFYGILLTRILLYFNVFRVYVIIPVIGRTFVSMWGVCVCEGKLIMVSNDFNDENLRYYMGHVNSDKYGQELKQRENKSFTVR